MNNINIVELLNTLNGLGWLFLAVFVLIRYAKTIQSVLNNLSLFALSKGDTKVEMRSKAFPDERDRLDEADAEKLIQIGEKAKKLFHQGKPYDDHTLAFSDAHHFIDTCFADRQHNNNDDPVRLKFIAVALTFSWNELICDRIPLLMEKYDKVNVKIDVVFCDPAYLKKLLPDSKDPNWAEVSQNRITQFREFAQEYGDFNGRMSFCAKTYTNLPHWHGVLVEGKYLFLGRANWKFINKHPKLRVGQNKYRYFDSIDDTYNEGAERIDLFKNWHRYYSETEWVSSYTIVKNEVLVASQKNQLEL